MVLKWILLNPKMVFLIFHIKSRMVSWCQRQRGNQNTWKKRKYITWIIAWNRYRQCSQRSHFNLLRIREIWKNCTNLLNLREQGLPKDLFYGGPISNMLILMNNDRSLSKKDPSSNTWTKYIKTPNILSGTPDTDLIILLMNLYIRYKSCFYNLTQIMSRI